MSPAFEDLQRFVLFCFLLVMGFESYDCFGLDIGENHSLCWIVLFVFVILKSSWGLSMFPFKSSEGSQSWYTSEFSHFYFLSELLKQDLQ